MNIYSVPILISGILCTLLSVITWLLRRRESINRIFSFFTLALALDAFAFFMWFQLGSVENINTWMRITFSGGFVVPTGLIFFFFAFTGYDKRMDVRVMGIKVRHFQISILLFIFVCMLLSLFTNLLIRISETPRDISDFELGPIGVTMFPLYLGIFAYLYVMVFKSYRITENKPQKRFILLLALGTGVWLLFGYGGALLFPISSEVWNAISYLGTTVMAVFYFVAIVNYQSDKVHELNLNLERKVEERTQELYEKNDTLEKTLSELKSAQSQLLQSEKMASLGQLVAGLTHEFNTPISTIRSVKNTKSKAIMKLQTALGNSAPDAAGRDHEIENVMEAILKADQLIDQGAERLDEIIKNLKNFIRLDEAEMKMADIHEGLESVLALIKHDLANIDVMREYGEIPPFVHHPGRLNQVFLNLLMNACQAIEDKGRITITTSLKKNMAHVVIRDTGKGIKPDELESIFVPDFTTRSSVVRTSLGLSMCYQIIQEHRGKIEVESQLGKGSVFTVIIPTEF